MSDRSAPVKAEGWEFDLWQIGDWIGTHLGLTLLIVGIVCLFYISRRDGLIGWVIEDLKARRELKAKVELDRARLMLKYRDLESRLPSPPPSLPSTNIPDRAVGEHDRRLG